MGNPHAFHRIPRQTRPLRPVADRVADWRPVDLPMPAARVQEQASRCMGCGIPFCHAGCPLGNVIPDFNRMVAGGDWDGAVDGLLATNNFPEFTGSVCPAPCEAACVAGVGGEPVSIAQRIIVECLVPVAARVNPTRDFENILARALAEGDGYRFTQMPGAPRATHYPPGYPLFLAALWTIARLGVVSPPMNRAMPTIPSLPTIAIPKTRPTP